jgi:type VI secretion system protein ImpE
MNPTELFRAGRLSEALDAQIQAVRAKPSDQEQRFFLFALLAFSGDLDRARRQIEALKYSEPEREMGRMAYARLLDAEALRRRLFSESLAPEFFSDPPEHLRLRLEAVNRLREQRPAEAHELLARADAACPTPRGTLNGKPFELLRDCDDLFSFVLEVMAHGKYFWVPLEQVESVTMKAPAQPHDEIWLPARLDLHEGESGLVYLPVLYPGSHEQADEELKLGRKNDWKGGAGGPILGVGRRQYLVGDEGVSLLEWRELVLERPAQS